MRRLTRGRVGSPRTPIAKIKKFRLNCQCVLHCQINSLYTITITNSSIDKHGELVTLCVQVFDELLPKATGREAKFEKKRGRAEARRDKECSPGE